MQIQTNDSTPFTTPAMIRTRRRRIIVPKVSSQLGSDAMASTTNITDTTKSTKKLETKIFDDQHIEDIISKAPVAAQSILKVQFNRSSVYV